jgi:hypothetical protein
VIEINASKRRSGAEILSRFSEATQSKRLAVGGGGGGSVLGALLSAASASHTTSLASPSASHTTSRASPSKSSKASGFASLFGKAAAKQEAKPAAAKTSKAAKSPAKAKSPAAKGKKGPSSVKQVAGQRSLFGGGVKHDDAGGKGAVEPPCKRARCDQAEEAAESVESVEVQAVPSPQRKRTLVRGHVHQTLPL